MKLGTGLLALLLSLALLAPLGAQDAPKPPVEKEGEGLAAPAGEEDEKPAPTEDEVGRAALATIDELAKQVEKLRGLEFKEPFARKIVSPEEVRKIAQEKIDEEIPPEELAAFTALYARLGFWSHTLDLAESFAKFLESGAGGMYDPDTKTLYLVKGFSIEGSKPILFHELVHALEDQYYALGDRQRKYMDDSDRGAALTGVVEGSASWLMDKYMKENPEAASAMMAEAMAKAQEQIRMLMEVPVPLVAGVGIYPYGNAPKFVEKVTGGVVEEIGALYENEPASSEQVLHPEKYGEGGDYPVLVKLPSLEDALPEGWKFAYKDSIGELQIGLLLNEFQGGPPLGRFMRIISLDNSLAFRGPTRRAAAGWDGDRAAAYSGPESAVGVIWASRWDSEKDAGEFAKAYEDGLAHKWDTLKQTPKTARILVRGRRVLVVDGFPEALVDKVVEAAWKGTTFEADERDPNDKGIPKTTPAPEK
jgi:hypothetical protein